LFAELVAAEEASLTEWDLAGSDVLAASDAY
jgi:hypothetical protein